MVNILQVKLFYQNKVGYKIIINLQKLASNNLVIKIFILSYSHN